MAKVPLEVPHPSGADKVSNEATGAVVTLSGGLALTVREAAAAVAVGTTVTPEYSRTTTEPFGPHVDHPFGTEIFQQEFPSTTTIKLA